MRVTQKICHRILFKIITEYEKLETYNDFSFVPGDEISLKIRRHRENYLLRWCLQTEGNLRNGCQLSPVSRLAQRSRDHEEHYSFLHQRPSARFAGKFLRRLCAGMFIVLFSFVVIASVLALIFFPFDSVSRFTKVFILTTYALLPSTVFT